MKISAVTSLSRNGSPHLHFNNLLDMADDVDTYLERILRDLSAVQRLALATRLLQTITPVPDTLPATETSSSPETLPNPPSPDPQSPGQRVGRFKTSLDVQQTDIQPLLSQILQPPKTSTSSESPLDISYLSIISPPKQTTFPSPPKRSLEPDVLSSDFVVKRVRRDNQSYSAELGQLLFRCLRTEDIHPIDPLTDPNRGKHTQLYAFLALSLVRLETKDVAAIAIYHLHRRAEIYWTKNTITADDISHAEALADLIRKCARTTMSSRGFIRRFCNILFQNCRGKLERRLEKLQTAFREVPSVSKNRQPESEDILSWNGLLKYAEENGDSMAEEGNRYDEAVRVYSKDGSIGGGVVGLLRLLDRWRVEDMKSGEDLAKVSSACQILCYVSVFVKCATFSTPVKVLRESLQKVAAYFRGLCKLYEALTENDAVRRNFSSCILRHINHPPQRRIKLSPEWYRILSVSYYRATESPIPLTKRELYEKLGHEIEKYVSDTTTQRTLEGHAEVTLVNYLVEMKKSPTEIGVSKSCCLTCYEYLSAVNKYLAADGVAQTWTFAGSHGKVYPNAQPSSKACKYALASNIDVEHALCRKAAQLINRLTLRQRPDSPSVFSPKTGYREIDDKALYADFALDGRREGQ